MRVLRGWLARLRSLLGRNAAERRMEDEFAFHIAMETQRNEARGMSAAEARRAALVSFGGPERYRVEMRAGRGFRWLSESVRDARLALRQLAREPAYTTSTILTLALSLGATTAVFSLMHRVVLAPLPYPESERVLQLATRYAGWGIEYGSVSQPEADDLSKLSAFASVAPYRRNPIDIALRDRAERARGLYASAELFHVLRITPLLGRGFTKQEDVPGGAAVAVLTYGVWQRMGADSAIIGSVVRLNAVPHTIVGVLGESFDFAGHSEIVIPLRLNAAEPFARGSHMLAVVGRLADGVSEQRAHEELSALSGRLRAEYTDNYTPDMRFALVARPLRDAVIGNVNMSLRLLAAAVVLVLVITCANVANLVLARTHRREREFAVRTALGAGRGRLIRQILVESLVLSLIGATVGLAIATAGTNALLAITPDSIPRISTLRVDVPMFLIAMLVAWGSAIAFGLIPAFRITRGNGQAVWQHWASARGASIGGWRRSHSAMSLLITLQFAFAVWVVIWAGVLSRSYLRLTRVDLGFASASVLAFDVTVPEAKYNEPQRVTHFYRELAQRLEREPDVTHVGGVRSLPLRSGTGSIDIELAENPLEPGESAPSPVIQVVTAGYFDAMQIPLERGRLPQATDDERAPLVAWVNRVAADRLWPGQDPLGKRFRFAGDTTDYWFTVAGVVGNVHTSAVRTAPVWEYYLLHPQLPRALDVSDFHRGLSMVVRTTGDPVTLAPRVRRLLRDMDESVAPAQIETMDAVVSRAISRPRLLALLLGVFALLAAVLATVGVYGVLSYAVGARTREIGIRVALGASRATVMTLMMRDGLRAALIGLIAGTVTATVGSRLLESHVYGVGAHDPLVYVVSVTALLLVAGVATLLPARTAARVPPAVALLVE